MGSFADIYKAENAKMREDKKAEFEERVEKLFDFGGMMELKVVQLYDNKIATINRVSMDDNGMEFSYNYFEDNFWECAGYSKKRSAVWSNKIGWSRFSWVMLAAYALEELYTDGLR